MRCGYFVASEWLWIEGNDATVRDCVTRFIPGHTNHPLIAYTWKKKKVRRDFYIDFVTVNRRGDGQLVTLSLLESKKERRKRKRGKEVQVRRLLPIDRVLIGSFIGCRNRDQVGIGFWSCYVRTEFRLCWDQCWHDTYPDVRVMRNERSWQTLDNDNMFWANFWFQKFTLVSDWGIEFIGQFCSLPNFYLPTWGHLHYLRLLTMWRRIS